MHQLGHYGAALTVYAPVGYVTATIWGLELAVAGGLVVLGLSTFPDVDQYVPVIDHRGPTHTVWFAVAVALLVAITAPAVPGATDTASTATLSGFGALVATLSIGSHLLADAITPMGVRPFWPVWNRHWTFDVVPAANPAANYLLLTVGVIAVTVVGLQLATAP